MEVTKELIIELFPIKMVCPTYQNQKLILRINIIWNNPGGNLQWPACGNISDVKYVHWELIIRKQQHLY
jgi:hypothetical protein